MTADVAFQAGKVNLSDGTVMNRVREQHQQKIEKQLAAMAKKQEAEAELRQKVDIVHGQRVYVQRTGMLMT